jgi:predicted permease
MLQILSVTGPIYLIIAVGFICVRWALFSKDKARVLGRFVVNFLCPCVGVPHPVAMHPRRGAQRPLPSSLCAGLADDAAGRGGLLTPFARQAHAADGPAGPGYVGIEQSLHRLSHHPSTDRAASPLALFVKGALLVGLRLDGLRHDITFVVLGKLLLHPLAVLGMLVLMPPVDPVFRVAAVVFASMPMLSLNPALAQKYPHESFCPAMLLAFTVLSFVTISA